MCVCVCVYENQSIRANHLLVKCIPKAMRCVGKFQSSANKNQSHNNDAHEMTWKRHTNADVHFLILFLAIFGCVFFSTIFVADVVNDMHANPFLNGRNSVEKILLIEIDLHSIPASNINAWESATSERELMSQCI